MAVRVYHRKYLPYGRQCMALVVLPVVLVRLLLRRPGPTYRGYDRVSDKAREAVSQVPLNSEPPKESGPPVRLPTNFTWQCPICAFVSRTDDEAMDHHDHTCHPVTIVEVV